MKKLFLLIVSGVLFAISCTEGGVDEHKERQILLSQSQMTFDFEGGEGAFTVTADCTWGAICKADWVEFIQTDGTIGESTLKFSVSRNTSIKERSATMIVTNGAYANIAKEVQIIQSGYVPTLEVVESVSLGGLACEEVIKITSDVEYTVADDADWLSCEIVAEGIKIAATANTNRDTRRAIVSICAKEDGSVLRRITVSQVIGPGIYTICYTSSDGKVVTPYNTDAFGEAEIVSNRYENGEGLIIFSKPVTEIGESAFYNCDSLTSIIISDYVTSIGHGAFYTCDALTSVTIGNGVTSIGTSAFSYCLSLTSITIPDSVTEIGGGAFFYCQSLTSITIPDSVTEIGGNAFSGCQSLTSVTISDGVFLNYCGSNICEYCPSLKAFYGKYASDDNRCLIIGGILNSFAPAGLTTYTIPESVTSIGPDAFSFCLSLTSITIPDSVTSIGIYAFAYCYALTSVYCKPTTPPWGGTEMFYGNASGRKIFVPKASVNLYKQAEYWSDYADDIVGFYF